LGDGVAPFSILAGLLVHLLGDLHLPRPQFWFLPPGAPTCPGRGEAVDGALR
jgi:hypothetical protein